MNTWTIAILVYVVVAMVAYLRWNYGSRSYRKPPRVQFRWATPWYYQPFGNWLFGYWDHRKWKGYPQRGFRLLGFEYWVEYWR